MLVAPDGVVVVDTQFADTATIALGNLKQMSPRSIDFLINTHHHGDHTSGNAVFRPAAAKHVAHRNVPTLQKAQAAAAKSETQQAYADTTYDTTWSAKLGAETVSLKYYGPGHTSGDSVVTFQNANVVHMGDLMFYLRNPRVDRGAGASVKNWIVTLEAVTKDHPADTIYIAGHSKAKPAAHRHTGRSAEVPRLLFRFARVRSEGHRVRTSVSRDCQSRQRSRVCRL